VRQTEDGGAKRLAVSLEQIRYLLRFANGADDASAAREQLFGKLFVLHAAAERNTETAAATERDLEAQRRGQRGGIVGAGARRQTWLEGK
jgi:hypothetical protein